MSILTSAVFVFIGWVIWERGRKNATYKLHYLDHIARSLVKIEEVFEGEKILTRSRHVLMNVHYIQLWGKDRGVTSLVTRWAVK